jgi:predicted NBD/HSP70 family sugar kinase
VDPIEERIALNEALFREVNENIRKAAGQGRHDDAHFICECGESTCEERIALRTAVYRSIRENPLHFFVKPGHEIPAAETVLERHDGFFVIEKPPAALDILEGGTL